MNSIRSYLIAMFFLFFSGLLIAQPNQKASGVVEPPEAKEQVLNTSAEPTITRRESELLLVKEQNRLIKEYQSSLQDMVIWALSGILGLVFVLTGLSLLTNFKFYDQDKNRLKSEFEGGIAAYRAEFNLQLEEFKRESDKVAGVESQIVQNRLISQMSEIRLFVENVRAELISDVKVVDNKFVGVDKKFIGVDKKIAALETELRQVEVLIWDIKDIPGNVIITQCQGLRAAVQSGRGETVKYVLKNIAASIESKFIEPSNSMSHYAHTAIVENIELAVSIDPDGVAKVRELIAKIGVTPDSNSSS